MKRYPGKNLTIQFLIITYQEHGEQLRIVLEFKRLDGEFINLQLKQNHQ